MRRLLPIPAVLALALLASAGAEADVLVVQETQSISAASPVAAQRLTDGSTSTCNGAAPSGTAAATSSRYASVTIHKLISETPCLTVGASSQQCTLWSAAYPGNFDPGAVATGMHGRGGTA